MQWRRPALSLALAGMLLAAGPLVGTASAQEDVTAPAAPEVTLLTDEPRAGDPVTVRFTSSDPDSGLDGFWYGIQEERKMEFVAAPAPAGETGSAEITFTAPPEGGRIWIYVWAEDIAGNHSDRATFDFFAPRDPPPPPEATRIALWGLSDTEDAEGDHHLTLSGVQGTDYEWVENWVCIPWQALDLRTPAAYAATDGEVIDTRESFSITALVFPGVPTGDDQTMLSQSGPVTPAVRLQQTAEGSWRFAVPSVSPRRPGGVAETAPGSLRPDVWNHLAGVVDVPGQEIRLYVNGELAAAAELAAGPWPARGPLYLGVAGSLQGRTAPFQGVLDAVSVWSGRLQESQIESITRAGAGFPPCFF